MSTMNRIIDFLRHFQEHEYANYLESLDFRTDIASRNMQGMLANPTVSIEPKEGQTSNEVIAKASVVLADALLAELNKE